MRDGPAGDDAARHVEGDQRQEVDAGLDGRRALDGLEPAMRSSDEVSVCARAAGGRGEAGERNVTHQIGR